MGIEVVTTRMFTCDYPDCGSNDSLPAGGKALPDDWYVVRNPDDDLDLIFVSCRNHCNSEYSEFGQKAE